MKTGPNPRTALGTGECLLGVALAAGITYLIFSSLRYIPLTAAAMLRATMPVLAVAYAAIGLGETIGWPRAVGGLLIVVGATLAPAGAKRQVGYDGGGSLA